MIEGFNQLPEEGRPMALDRMRQVWMRKSVLFFNMLLYMPKNIF
jgi:hypothetical protein